MVIKKKDDKEEEVQNGWVGHVIPFDLVQTTLLREDYDALKAKEARFDEIAAELTEIIDSIDEGDRGEFLNPPYEILSVKNENYEYLTFLTTYIIPLICIDLTKVRYVIVLGVLLVLIGFIFIRMDLYYGNPTLALMGYRLYRAEIKGCEAPDGIILISRDRLNKASSIKWIPIDEYVWIAKEIKNDI